MPWWRSRDKTKKLVLLWSHCLIDSATESLRNKKLLRWSIAARNMLEICACHTFDQTFTWLWHPLKNQSRTLERIHSSQASQRVYKPLWRSYQPPTYGCFKTSFTSEEPKWFNWLHLDLQPVSKSALHRCLQSQGGKLYFTESSVCIECLL